MFIFICCRAFASDPVVHSNGMGSKALSLANTFVAISDDFSSIYWNPAGFAFIPVREVQLSLDFLKTEAKTSLDTTETEISRQRFRLGNIGFIRSIPTTQGGMSLAFGFSSPVLFDNHYNFRGWDLYLGQDPDTSMYLKDIKDSVIYKETIINNTIKIDTIIKHDTIFDILNQGGFLYTDTARTRTYGQLNMISGALGWQIAPGLGFGTTISMIFGKEYQKIRLKTYNSDFELFEDTEEDLIRSYVGIDFRAGLLYKPIEWLRFGLSINIPQYIKFEEEYIYREKHYGYTFEALYSGALISSFTGSFGAAIRFPYLLLTAQVNFRTPMAVNSESNDKQYWKIGTSYGIEVPIPAISTFLRAGYSWSELDISPYKIDYDQVDIFSFEPRRSLDRGCHLLTLGLSLFLRDTFVFETAYGYSMKEFTIYDQNWFFDIKETHSRHRIQCTFSLHY
jgi:hypothetical protein